MVCTSPDKLPSFAQDFPSLRGCSPQPKDGLGRFLDPLVVGGHLVIEGFVVCGAPSWRVLDVSQQRDAHGCHVGLHRSQEGGFGLGRRGRAGGDESGEGRRPGV